MKHVGRFLLGMFVVWQVFFLVSHNTLTMLEEARTDLPDWAVNLIELIDPQWVQGQGELHDSIDSFLEVTGAYCDLTAQPQGWALFAPNPSSEATFVALELKWNEEEYKAIIATQLAPLIAAANPRQILAAANAATSRPPKMHQAPAWIYSKNEPTDRRSYFRLGRFRLRRYEGQLDVLLRVFDGETKQEAKKRWADLILEEIQTDWDAELAYMKWRIAQHRDGKQEQPMPKQVILHIRRYHIPPPDDGEHWDWTGPYSMPIARWLPHEKTPRGALPIQMYDPVVERFVWLK